MDPIYVDGTKEYLDVEVTANVTLNSQPVEVSFDRETWYDAAFIGEVGTTRDVRLMLDTPGADPAVPLPQGRVNVWVRITNEPEIPVFSAGIIQVI